MKSQLLLKISRRMSLVLGSATPWVFLLGVLAIGLITEGASKLIDAYIEGTNLLPSQITLAIGCVLVVGVVALFDLPRLTRRWLLQLRGDRFNLEANVPRRKGLVVIVSHGVNRSAEPAIRYHLRGLQDEYENPVLEYCWLLAGPGEGSDSSIMNAEHMHDFYETQGVIVDIWQIKDADNPLEVYHAVNSIYRSAEVQYGLLPENMIADFTGGTKCMTAGMVLACAAGNWDMQYMKPDKITAEGRPAPDAVAYPRLINVDFSLTNQSKTSP